MSNPPIVLRLGATQTLGGEDGEMLLNAIQHGRSSTVQLRGKTVAIEMGTGDYPVPAMA